MVVVLLEVSPISTQHHCGLVRLNSGFIAVSSRKSPGHSVPINYGGTGAFVQTCAPDTSLSELCWQLLPPCGFDLLRHALICRHLWDRHVVSNQLYSILASVDSLQSRCGNCSEMIPGTWAKLTAKCYLQNLVKFMWRLMREVFFFFLKKWWVWTFQMHCKINRCYSGSQAEQLVILREGCVNVKEETKLSQKSETPEKRNQ